MEHDFSFIAERIHNVAEPPPADRRRPEALDLAQSGLVKIEFYRDILLGTPKLSPNFAECGPCFFVQIVLHGHVSCNEGIAALTGDTPRLSDGLYPFIDQRLPLSELAMVEAPPPLEALFKAQAAANGIEIIRDEPVELRCQSEEYPDATFLIYWPQGQDRIHMLAPKEFLKGQA
jgi:hypothetical protein